MKKLSLYVFLVLMFYNVGFTQCIEGDCKNGYGTFTFPDGRKYVGNLKIVNITDKELSRGQPEQNMLENGKKMKCAGKELTLV